MGRKATEKRIKKSMGITGKEYKKVRRSAKLAFYDTGKVDSDGHKILIALNPLKKMIQGKPYKNELGAKVMGQEAVRYATFLQKIAQKKKDTVETKDGGND